MRLYYFSVELSTYVHRSMKLVIMMTVMKNSDVNPFFVWGLSTHYYVFYLNIHTPMIIGSVDMIYIR